MFNDELSYVLYKSILLFPVFYIVLGSFIQLCCSSDIVLIEMFRFDVNLEDYLQGFLIEHIAATTSSNS